VTVLRWVLLLVAALVVLDAAGLALMVVLRRWHEQGRVRPARSGVAYPDLRATYSVSEPRVRTRA
jgi:hypothetical protein